MVARHLDTHPDAVVDAVRDALDHVLEPVAATVRVHPDDLAAAEEAAPGLTPPGGGAVRVVASDGVDRGGCVVDHGAGEVDARVRVKLARLAELLLGGKQAPPEEEPRDEAPPAGGGDE